MRAVTYVRNNTIEIVEKPVPEIQPDEILLKVGGAGLCHTDITIVGMGDENPFVGFTLGHEIAGTVERLGAAVTGWEVGQRGIVSVILSCGNCRECLAGRDNLCETVYPRGSLAPAAPGVGSTGGMSDYYAVKAHHLLPIGDLDPALVAPLADAAVTPMNAIRSVRDRTTGDATVVTLGLGGLGHLALQILAATTGARIIALDIDPEKVAYAASHGADLALLNDEHAEARIIEATGGKGADVVFDFVGVQATVDLAVRVVRGGGAIRFVGNGGGTFEYGAQNLPWGVNIMRPGGGTRSDLLEVIGLAQSGRIGVEVVTYPLDDAERAFDDLRNDRVQGRAVLVP